MDKPPRVVKQTPDGTVIVKSSAVHGTKQMRCPRCHGMCASIKDASGRDVLHCSSCKANYSSRPM